MPFVKEVSIALALLAAVTFGIALADIIYTKVTVCDSNSAPACDPASIGIILTYVGSGCWASLFVFIAAVWGVCYAVDPIGSRERYLTLLFLAAIIFIPAMTIISCVIIYMVLEETPGASDSTSLYDFSTPDDGYLVKFILPTCVALLGLLQFFLAAGLMIYIYATTSKETDEELPEPPRPIISQGFGYYYPSRIYELRAGTPGYSSGARYYY